jgi:hypothetical protein
MKKPKPKATKDLEKLIDHEAEDSFPASDPPAFSGMRSGAPKADPEPPVNTIRDGTDAAKDAAEEIDNDAKNPRKQRWPDAIPQE